MEGYEFVRAVVHWIHAVAALAWVGGSLFYLVVLRPALVAAVASERALEMAVNRGFKDVVDVSIVSLVLTGIFITFDRLSSQPATLLYYAVLALKLTTVVVMVLMARQLGTRTGRLLRSRGLTPSAGPAAPAFPRTSVLRRWLAPPRMILVLGLTVFFLSMVLARIYEHNLRIPA